MTEMMNRRGLSRATYALLFTVTLATAVGNLGLVSVMPAIGRALSIPDALVACTFSFSALIWALSSPVWARISDRRGRKPMLLIGMLGFMGSMTGCGLVVLAGLHGLAAATVIFAAFALIRSSYGLFGSAAATAAQAFIADHSHGRNRVRALSGLAGALSIGTIVGPALAPLLIVAPVGLAGPMLGFAAIGAALFVLIAVGIANDRPEATIAIDAPPARSLWHDATLRPLLVQGLVVGSAQAINTYTLGFAVIDAMHKPPVEAQSMIGLAMSLGAASGLVAQIGIVNLLRPSPAAMLRWGALLVVAGNALVIAHGGLLTLLVGFPLACLGYGLARPGFAVAASIAVGPERQGAVAGAVSSIAGASITLPPIIAVACYQFWWGAPFAIAGLACGWVFIASLRARTPLFPVSD